MNKMTKQELLNISDFRHRFLGVIDPLDIINHNRICDGDQKFSKKEFIALNPELEQIIEWNNSGNLPLFSKQEFLIASNVYFTISLEGDTIIIITDVTPNNWLGDRILYPHTIERWNKNNSKDKIELKDIAYRAIGDRMNLNDLEHKNIIMISRDDYNDQYELQHKWYNKIANTICQYLKLIKTKMLYLITGK